MKHFRVFCGETIEGIDCGDEIAKWVSDFLEVEGLRVVRYVEGMKFRDIYAQNWKTWETSAAAGDTVSIITKTCLHNFDPLKPHFYIVKLGLKGLVIIYLFLLKNMDCVYLLELPRGGSTNYPQSMF